MTKLNQLHELEKPSDSAKAYRRYDPTDLFLAEVAKELQLKEPISTEFLRLALEQVVLFDKKQQDYGPGNIAAFGTQGVLVRISDKFERLKNLFKRQTQPNNESIVDSFKDMSNYAIIAQLVENGKWPKS